MPRLVVQNKVGTLESRLAEPDIPKTRRPGAEPPRPIAPGGLTTPKGVAPRARTRDRGHGSVLSREDVFEKLLEVVNPGRMSPVVKGHECPSRHWVRGGAETDGGPAPWPAASGGDDGAAIAGPPGREGQAARRRGRPNCLLFHNPVVSYTHTITCGSGTNHLHENVDPLEEGSLLDRGTVRPMRPRGSRPGGRGPRRRIGVVKFLRARGGCLGVIRIRA